MKEKNLPSLEAVSKEDVRHLQIITWLQRFPLRCLTSLLLLVLCPTFASATVHHVTVNINQPSPLVANAGNDITICTGSRDTLHASGGLTYKWSPKDSLSCTDCQNPIANPTTKTTYIVEVSGANGCTAKDSVTVTVSSTITANAGQDTSVCKGDTIQLLAKGGSIYTWTPITGLNDPNTDAPRASPEVTTTYTVIVSGGGECPADTDEVKVTVYLKPQEPTITKSGNQLRSSAASGNQWYHNATIIMGAVGQVYTVPQSEGGDYTVCVTIDPGHCSSCSTPTHVVGVRDEDQKLTHSFSLFPNPNNGTFTVVFDANQIADYDIELRDVLGRGVHGEHLANFIGHYSQQVDLSVYPKGFYSLSLRNGKEIMVRKVVTY